MEPTSKLTPQEGCSLAATLFPEEYKVNRARAVVRAMMWLAVAVGETSGESAFPVKPARDSRIERLDQIVGERGPEAVAKQIGASINSLRAWLYGAPPNAASLAKIERFLEMPSPAAAEKPAESAELFVAEPPATPEPTTQS
jgi:hypothetical protein